MQTMQSVLGREALAKLTEKEAEAQEIHEQIEALCELSYDLNPRVIEKLQEQLMDLDADIEEIYSQIR